jgi:protocatechuate 3,4-dioxygenase alpha subunit
VTARPEITPSQTVGPFFHDCLLRDGARREVVGGDEDGVEIRVHGRVLDGDGAGVPDAVIEVWQATGFARVGTDEYGGFSFTAVRARPMPFDRTTLQAPHLSVAVFARGLLNHLFTRIYFADEPSTSADPILGRVPEARRRTLIARLEPGDSLTRTYRFDIVLQGDAETVFLDFKAPRP